MSYQYYSEEQINAMREVDEINAAWELSEAYEEITNGISEPLEPFYWPEEGEVVNG